MLAGPKSLASRHAAAGALLVAALAGTAGRLAAQAQCDVNETSPSQLGKAFLAVTSAQQAQSTGNTAEAAKHLQAAMKTLTDQPEKLKNPLGRQLLLGRTLALWAVQPGTPAVTTRGTLGWAGDPAATVDLYATLDSTLTAVETAQPGCAAETARLRQGKAWLGLVNGAIENFNADRADSAETLARRSLQLYRGAPYAEMLLGNIENKRGRPASAIEHYGRAVTAAASDTGFAEQHRGILLTMGNAAAGIADTAQGAEKQRWSREASATFDKLAAQFPGSPEARAAADRQAQLRLSLGDTAAVRAAYADQLASPEKYSYQQLLTAGVNASRAGQPGDALRLFEGTLKVNPYNRDALYNAALVAHDRKEFDKSIGYLNRLVQIDPGNDQGWLLLAHDYAGLNKATKVTKVANQYRDSLTKYLERSQNLPYQVRFTEWSNGTDKSTLRGAIRNKGTAAKSYTMTIEFLDAAGNVVGTQPVQVANVAAGAEGTFTAETTAAKAVGFRYKVE
jgi:tetratricopeptide (TPR) repeat protein